MCSYDRQTVSVIQHQLWLWSIAPWKNLPFFFAISISLLCDSIASFSRSSSKTFPKHISSELKVFGRYCITKEKKVRLRLILKHGWAFGCSNNSTKNIQIFTGSGCFFLHLDQWLIVARWFTIWNCHIGNSFFHLCFLLKQAFTHKFVLKSVAAAKEESTLPVSSTREFFLL